MHSSLKRGALAHSFIDRDRSAGWRLGLPERNHPFTERGDSLARLESLVDGLAQRREAYRAALAVGGRLAVFEGNLRTPGIAEQARLSNAATTLVPLTLTAASVLAPTLLIRHNRAARSPGSV